VTSQFAAGYDVSGWQETFRSGPTLFVSNHPGLTDALALFAAIGRNDLAIIARHRDFLHAIPNIARYLIYVSDEGSDRSLAIRAVRDHLRAGRSVLLFPAGKIEPDPLALPGAAEALSAWSGSIGLIARLTPEARIVPVIVSGVLSRAALRNPITRIRRQKKDREWLAATLQVIVPAYQRVQVRICFGPPARAGELVAQYGDSAAVTQAVIARARALLPAQDLSA
jgi:1-acyl-sn-glycerol-3-phosphate acyltransferase